MTLQEKELLTQFLQQLALAQAGQKDAEAEKLIREACAKQPDALYLLTQRAIQLEQLLQASQSEVARLQSEQGQTGAAARGGFLGDSYAWGTRPQAAVNAAPQRAPATAATARGGSWGSGLFGNIASTAAGVVAGSFLFQGLQGLMNRGEAPNPESFAADHAKQAEAQEPELLNSFDTADSGEDSFLADADGGGDFA